MAGGKELEMQLEREAKAFQTIQKEIQKNHQLRQQFKTQLGENELVKTELDILDDESNVYKLIGPVLVKQDLVEAKANVDKRIEYISGETKRLDGALKDLERKASEKRQEVMKMQQRLQDLRSQAAK
ncbi:Prefoldin subunit 6 [Klebsormidium nitens]|uniref:Prefoldin subunit 6 n=1 Tax=Klebsormidium nitens TaxID=105231 RepID=A0A1Y1IBU9_KLENI|nr:Prefoldin subunit 6 [Klebsormidium nitens]|eukprot:GAQ88390.1 Prefoldin subunit 6 [Klebsormidium nitens]